MELGPIFRLDNIGLMILQANHNIYLNYFRWISEHTFFEILVSEYFLNNIVGVFSNHKLLTLMQVYLLLQLRLLLQKTSLSGGSGGFSSTTSASASWSVAGWTTWGSGWTWAGAGMVSVCWSKQCNKEQLTKLPDVNQALWNRMGPRGECSAQSEAVTHSVRKSVINCVIYREILSVILSVIHSVIEVV